jgi:hypothetical protein
MIETVLNVRSHYVENDAEPPAAAHTTAAAKIFAAETKLIMFVCVNIL